MKVLEALNNAYYEDKLSYKRDWGEKESFLYDNYLFGKENADGLEDAITDAICERADTAFYDGFASAMELVLSCVMRTGGER